MNAIRIWVSIERIGLLAKVEPSSHSSHQTSNYPNPCNYNQGNAGPSSPNQESFVQRWRKSSASERANYALFLSEVCDFLDLPRPDPSQADESLNAYMIDKAVHFTEFEGSTTTNYIDLYRRNCFVLEAKQGSAEESSAPVH
jgi:hypothetical protein